MSDDFGLSNKVESTMFDELQYIWNTVRTVKVHISLLLADECLIPVRLEKFPYPNEIFNHTDI